MNKIILGIDPGYDRCGVAVISTRPTITLLYSDCLTTNPKAVFSNRLASLGSSLDKIIKEYKPSDIVLEKLFFSKNQKTASRVAEVRGVILYLAGIHHLTTTEYAPSEIKLTITGFGGANKQQITAIVPKLIKIIKLPRHDDEYDAIAVALTHQAHSPN
ncbi:MAG: crossover junction endodeoxyribonuclease RuvC [Candidatus Vogelbacteria bacterium]|nr:crossover junction endodeoxyribonuclease RuvC [Candidatus Vogelbacteria bacterium]